MDEAKFERMFKRIFREIDEDNSQTLDKKEVYIFVKGYTSGVYDVVHDEDAENAEGGQREYVRHR